jgi:hypothetical protein
MPSQSEAFALQGCTSIAALVLTALIKPDDAVDDAEPPSCSLSYSLSANSWICILIYVSCGWTCLSWLIILPLASVSAELCIA